MAASEITPYVVGFLGIAVVFIQYFLNKGSITATKNKTEGDVSKIAFENIQAILRQSALDVDFWKMQAATKDVLLIAKNEENAKLVENLIRERNDNDTLRKDVALLRTEVNELKTILKLEGEKNE